MFSSEYETKALRQFNKTSIVEQQKFYCLSHVKHKYTHIINKNKHYQPGNILNHRVTISNYKLFTKILSHSYIKSKKCCYRMNNFLCIQ